MIDDPAGVGDIGDPIQYAEELMFVFEGKHFALAFVLSKMRQNISSPNRYSAYSEVMNILKENDFNAISCNMEGSK